jgi:hypothetical protein
MRAHKFTYVNTAALVDVHLRSTDVILLLSAGGFLLMRHGNLHLFT